MYPSEPPPCPPPAAVLYSAGVAPRLRPVLVLALAALGGRAAHAQTRPLVTEPATTAPAGTIVFETGFDGMADEPSYVTGVERTRWDGPLLRLVFSPAASVELDLEWVARVGVRGEEGRGDVASSEPGDVSLRAKWRVVESRGRRPAIGARFGVVLPQTSFEDEDFNPLGLGPNTLRAFVEALLTQPLGPVLLHGNAGLLLHDEVYRPHDQRDFFTYGLALEWPAGGGFTLLAEVAGRAGDGAPGAEARSEARAGLRYGRRRVRVDAAARRGLSEADGTWGATVGLAWDLRATGAPPRSRP